MSFYLHNTLITALLATTVSANVVTADLVPVFDKPPSATSSGYAKGQCSFHLIATKLCNYFLPGNPVGNITLWDNNKTILYQTSQGTVYDGDAMSADKPLSIQGPLPNALQAVGGLYTGIVKFKYGDISWESGTPSGGAQCNVGPTEGDSFYCQTSMWLATMDTPIDCSFPC